MTFVPDNRYADPDEHPLPESASPPPDNPDGVEPNEGSSSAAGRDEYSAQIGNGEVGTTGDGSRSTEGANPQLVQALQSILKGMKLNDKDVAIVLIVSSVTWQGAFFKRTNRECTEYQFMGAMIVKGKYKIIIKLKNGGTEILGPFDFEQAFAVEFTYEICWVPGRPWYADPSTVMTSLVSIPSAMGMTGRLNTVAAQSPRSGTYSRFALPRDLNMGEGLLHAGDA